MGSEQFLGGSSQGKPNGETLGRSLSSKHFCHAIFYDLDLSRIQAIEQWLDHSITSNLILSSFN